MKYSTAKLATTADCDLLLTMASKEKENLDFKRLSEERQKNNYSENSVEIEAELQTVNAEITASETIIAELPDGPTKQDTEKKKVKLEYRRFLLDDRRESYGVVALLEKELDLSRLSLELTEVDTFIAELNDRKAAIQ